MERPNFFTLKNGEKAKLPFTDQEYQSRLTKLRTTMSKNNLDMIILTSMHNIAYYTGFIYCSFGRPYGCVVTANKISTISANIDASQPWRRSHSDNVIYTDWKRDNFLKAIVSIIGRDEPPKNIGIENDHVTLDVKEKLTSIFTFSVFSDVSKDLMQLRMIKSDEEIEIIKNGARIADLGGEEIVKNIKVGESELEIAIAGRDRMEREIAKTYPDAEYMDTWVWFQSGLNTDGAHNPKTNRKLKSGDILSLNTFPMISGYYTALERTLFVDEIDDASLNISRSLQGQSPYIVNTGLLYDVVEKGFNATVLFNQVGKRIYLVGDIQAGAGTPDVYENPRSLIDFQVSKKFAKNKAEIKLTISDLLNQRQIFYQNNNSNTDYNTTTDAIRLSRKFGTTYGVTINYSL